MIKKLAILTSGGDAPGMNPAIRSLVLEARRNNIKTYLVKNGYKGLVDINQIIDADSYDMDLFLNKGGSLIGSARFLEFKNLETRLKAKTNLDKLEIDAIAVIGGDGSYKGAIRLHEMGLKVVCLPGTIDNDISSSEFTIGYFTAIDNIVDAIEKIRDTMDSHNRVAIVEVMGHGCGDLALYGGLASGAEIIITNEFQYTTNQIVKIIEEQMKKPYKKSVIIIVSEFIYPNLQDLAKEIENKSNYITRAITLSHIQRGGKPNAIERINAIRMGKKAIKLLINNNSGIAIGLKDNKTYFLPIEKALEMKNIDKKEKAIDYNEFNQSS